MGVERGELALRVLGIVGHVVLARTPTQRRAAGLVPAEDRLLLAQRRAVPALHEIADDAHRLIGAVARPFGLVIVLANPDDAVHHVGILRVRIGRPVAKAEEVSRAFMHALGARRQDRHGALLLPAHQKQVGEGLDEIAQGVDRGVRRVGANLHGEVAMAEIGHQRIVLELRHALETAGLGRCQPRPVIEEGRAERQGHGEIVGWHDRAQNAGIGRGQPGVEFGHRAARHQKAKPLRQAAQETLDILRALRHRVEGHDHAGRRPRRDDAALMSTVKGLRFARCVALRRFRDLIVLRVAALARGMGGVERGGSGRASRQPCQKPTPVGDEPVLDWLFPIHHTLS